MNIYLLYYCRTEIEFYVQFYSMHRTFGRALGALFIKLNYIVQDTGSRL